jgi:hypothetical protein
VTSALEQLAHDRWLAFADDVRFDQCDRCHRTRDHDGRPLLVARQPRKRLKLCLECFDQEPTR